tara:strand:- start:6 stop:143 length:138 start_codon:yes stop_codon:yes gene_type:complete
MGNNKAKNMKNLGFEINKISKYVNNNDFGKPYLYLNIKFFLKNKK